MVTATEKIILSDLMFKSLGGDQKSYEQFLFHVSKIAGAFVAKKIIAADVKDVVQEILISIHKARHTYDFKRPLMPWLMSIINFRINDYLRKHYAQMRHKTSDIDDFIETLIDIEEKPIGEELVDEMLMMFDDKKQKILRLIYVDGLSMKEVGEAMKMSESAIKVTAHRAIKKLKQKFLSR
jgi:RNA polymerase sigma-70 factor (ECF subfamily)